jgi:hypothetical protein
MVREIATLNRARFGACLAHPDRRPLRGQKLSVTARCARKVGHLRLGLLLVPGRLLSGATMDQADTV